MNLSDSEIAIAKKIAIQRLAKQVVAKLAAEAAFFGWPVVGQVTGFVASIAISFVIEWTELGITMVAIWVANAREVKEAIKTRDELKEKLAKKEDVKDAERKFNEAADNLVKLRIRGV